MLYLCVRGKPFTQIDTIYASGKSDVSFEDAMHQRKHREEYWKILSEWSWKQDYTGNFYGSCTNDAWPLECIPGAHCLLLKTDGYGSSLSVADGGDFENLAIGIPPVSAEKLLREYEGSLQLFSVDPASPTFRSRTLHLSIFRTGNDKNLQIELGIPSGRSIIASATNGEDTSVVFTDEHSYPLETSCDLVSDLCVDLTGRVLSFGPLHFSVPAYLLSEKPANTRRLLLQLLTEARTPESSLMVDYFLNYGDIL
jgi:hypothetical protein